MYFSIRNDVSNELRELTDLIVHIVSADIKNLSRYPLRLLFNPMDEGPHHVIDVHEWPPLVAPAHDVNDALLPSSQSHDIDRKIESHSGSKPKDGCIAKYDRLKVRISEISQ